MTDAQAYCLMEAIRSVADAVDAVAATVGDARAYRRVRKDMEMCRAALEQAGLHVVEEKGE